MKEGYVYIARNDSYIDNVLKIGCTRKDPLLRIKSLNSQTGVYGEFKLLFSKKFKNVNSAEKRIHMILKEHRSSSNKEFFKVSFEKAKETVTYLSEMEEFHQTRKIEDIEWNDELKKQWWSICGDATNTIPSNILLALMAYTAGNSTIDKIFNSEQIVSFLNTYDLELNLDMKHSSAVYAMKSFHKKYQDLNFLFNEEKIKIFESLSYEKGELCWVFTSEFSKLFRNNYMHNF